MSFFAFAIDAALSRADTALLPDQVLMELLVEPFATEAKKRFLDADGVFLDVCEWHDVECDESANVIKVNWWWEDFCSTIELHLAPQKIESLLLSYNGLKGTVDLTRLPNALERLFLDGNEFHGRLDLTQLPPRIKCIYLDHNGFEGTIDVRSLPGTMEQLDLESTKISAIRRCDSMLENLQISRETIPYVYE